MATKIVSPPLSLICASGLILAGCLLGAFAPSIYFNTSVFKIPPEIIGACAGGFFLFAFPMAWATLKGKRSSWRALLGFACLFGLLGITLSIITRNSNLGFLGFFILIYYSSLSIWVSLILRSSYINASLPWYEGLPKPLPGVSCLKINDLGFLPGEVRVSQIDRKGIFIFFTNLEIFKKLSHQKKLDLVISVNDKTIQCSGKRVTIESARNGLGICFDPLPSDIQYQLGKMIEFLLGEGYAT